MSAEIYRMPGTEEPHAGTQPGASADVVELLEKMLDMAKAGKIQGVAVATVERGGVIADAWASSVSVDTHMLVAAAAYLQNRIAFAGNFPSLYAMSKT